MTEPQIAQQPLCQFLPLPQRRMAAPNQIGMRDIREYAEAAGAGEGRAFRHGPYFREGSPILRLAAGTWHRHRIVREVFYG